MANLAAPNASNDGEEPSSCQETVTVSPAFQTVEPTGSVIYVRVRFKRAIPQKNELDVHRPWRAPTSRGQKGQRLRVWRTLEDENQGGEAFQKERRRKERVKKECKVRESVGGSRAETMGCNVDVEE